MEFTPMIILAQKGSTIYPNTNLPVTLWFYNDNAHTGNIIYMQNNYNKYTTGNDLVPISLDKTNPKVLEDVSLNITNKDFKRVQRFIINHYEDLIRVANGGKIDYATMELTYMNRFKPTLVDGFFIETISKRYTHLPVNLYNYDNTIPYDDERDMYTLLIDNKYCNSSLNEYCVTVSIDKENPKLVYDVELGISEDDFEQVKKFIKENYNSFERFIKGEIDAYELHHMLEPFDFNFESE